MAKLTISIINYRTIDLTEKCIKSVLDKKWKTDYEIYLVDNDSGDGSVETLEKKFPSVKIIKSKKNLGFAGGHNLVLRKIKSEYTLLLNSDAEVSDGSIDKIVEFMDKNLDVGVGSCKVSGFNGELQPNGGDEPSVGAVINWLFNLEAIGFRNPSFHRMEKEYYDETKEVGWVSGNFTIIRNEILEKVGFLNDDYFMYFEDVEFCYRVRKAGFKVMLYPEVNIKHLSGGSADKPRFRQWLGEYRGLIRFYKDNYGELGYLFTKTLVILTTILRVVAFTLVGKLEYSKTYAEVLKSI